MKQGVTEMQNEQSWKQWLKKVEAVRVSGSTPGERRKKYVQLKEDAQSASDLTFHQVDGIVGRCDYRIHLIDNANEAPFANSEKAQTQQQETLTKATQSTRK